MSEYILWADVETTGLDAHQCHLLQIAGFISDLRGNRIDNDHFEFIIKGDPVALRNEAVPLVQQMHDKTGLWDRLATGADRDVVDAAICLFISKRVGEDELIHLGGNSVRLDFNFADKHLPQLANRLHYQVYDVTSIRQAFLAYDLIEHEYKKSKAHEALSDITESVAEYRWMMEQVRRA